MVGSKRVLCVLAACSTASGIGPLPRAQDYTINLPLPPDPAAGGGDVTVFQVAPDGTRAAYVANAETLAARELYCVPLDGSGVASKLSPPLAAFGSIAYFQFTPDSQRVVMAADAVTFQEYRLYSAPADGSAAPVQLHGTLPEGCDAGDPGLSARPQVGGDRLVFVADLEVDGVFEIFSVLLDGSSPPVRLNGVLGPGRDVSTSRFWLTPDGTRALFLSDQSVDEVFDLWSAPVDGSTGPTRIQQVYSPTTGLGGEGGSPLQLTPDGVELVFRADLAENDIYDLFVLPITGGQIELVMDGLPAHADVFEFALSPDGSQVVLRMDKLTDGVYELWSTPAHYGNPPVRLSGPMAPGGSVDGSGLSDPFQITSDGSRVVYRADQTANDRFELFSAPLDGSSPPIRLTVLPPFRSVSAYRISPDSHFVVYLANPRNASVDELFVVPIGGGHPQRLNGPLVSGGDVQRDFRLGAQHVVFRADALVNDAFELFSAPLMGHPPHARDLQGAFRPTGPTRLNTPLGTGADVDTGFALLAGGLEVLYVADLTQPQLHELFLSPANGSGPPEVQNGPLTPGDPFGDVRDFTFAGERMLYSGTQDDPANGELYSVVLDGTLSRVKLHDHVLDGGNVLDLRVTPDAQSVVYRADVHQPNSYGLWSAPVDGSAAPLDLSGPFASNGRVEAGFVITESTARAVFAGDLDTAGIFDLYSALLDGSGPRVKLSSGFTSSRELDGFQCSADGQWVVFRADAALEECLELYSVPSDGSAAAVRLNGPLIPDGDVLSGALLSADSAHVVFVADESDGVFEVFAAPIDGSAPAWRLHSTLAGPADAALHALTPDGTTALFSSDALLDGSSDLYSVPVDGSGAPLRLTPPYTGAGVSRCILMEGGTRAAFVARPSAVGGDRLFSVPVDASSLPIEIGSALSGGQYIAALWSSPDGTRVVYLVGGTWSLNVARSDGSVPAIQLAAMGSFDDLAFSFDGAVVYRAREISSGPLELFRVPIDGSAAPARLHIQLVMGREVTGFALDEARERVLFRADLEADERFELFLTLLD